LHLQNLFVFG
jgi:hypothetical protein